MEKKKNELMKKVKEVPTAEQLIQGMSDMVSGKKKVTGDDLLKFLRKNKSGKLKDIPSNIILPMFSLIHSMKNDMDENISASYALGMFLNDEPFIPQYLGFEENVMDVDGFVMRTYRKGNMVIMRNYFEKIEAGKDKWVVTKNVGDDSLIETTSVHTFENMLEAVTALKTLGSGVSVLDVVTSKYVS